MKEQSLIIKRRPRPFLILKNVRPVPRFGYYDKLMENQSPKGHINNSILLKWMRMLRVIFRIAVRQRSILHMILIIRTCRSLDNPPGPSQAQSLDHLFAKNCMSLSRCPLHPPPREHISLPSGL